MAEGFLTCKCDPESDAPVPLIIKLSAGQFWGNAVTAYRRNASVQYPNLTPRLGRIHPQTLNRITQMKDRGRIRLCHNLFCPQFVFWRDRHSNGAQILYTAPLYPFEPPARSQFFPSADRRSPQLVIPIASSALWSRKTFFNFKITQVMRFCWILWKLLLQIKPHASFEPFGNILPLWELLLRELSGYLFTAYYRSIHMPIIKYVGTYNMLGIKQAMKQ